MAPKWIVIQLLEKCNLKCKMCYQWGDTGSYLEKEIIETLDLNLICNIVEQCKLWKPIYGLFGGEPMLYKYLWETISMMKRSGSLVYMDTNGTLIESNTEQIIESKIDRLWVSLDGIEEINDLQRGKNVYKKVVNGIRKLLEEKEKQNSATPQIGITYIVTPLNYFCIEDLFCRDLNISNLDYISIEFQNFITYNDLYDYEKILSGEFNVQSVTSAKSVLRDVGFFSDIDFQLLSNQIKKLQTKCVKENVNLLTSPINIEKDNIENYFKGEWTNLEKRKLSCQLPWLYAEVTAKGDVTTCHTFYDYILGNVKEMELNKIFNNNLATDMRNYLKKNKLLPICTACSRYHTDMNLKF